jgi:hypothetical protein
MAGFLFPFSYYGAATRRRQSSQSVSLVRSLRRRRRLPPSLLTGWLAGWLLEKKTKNKNKKKRRSRRLQYAFSLLVFGEKQKNGLLLRFIRHVSPRSLLLISRRPHSSNVTQAEG